MNSLFAIACTAKPSKATNRVRISSKDCRFGLKNDEMLSPAVVVDDDDDGISSAFRFLDGTSFAFELVFGVIVI